VLVGGLEEHGVHGALGEVGADDLHQRGDIVPVMPVLSGGVDTAVGLQFDAGGRDEPAVLGVAGARLELGMPERRKGLANQEHTATCDQRCQSDGVEPKPAAAVAAGRVAGARDRVIGRVGDLVYEVWD